MAQRAVKQYAASIRLACNAFSISEKCYRYQAKLSSDNQQIADWLLRLTHNQRNWGFGLCYLYLRNVKGFKWNHKRIYRIYRERELNMLSPAFPTLRGSEYWHPKQWLLYSFDTGLLARLLELGNNVFLVNTVFRKQSIQRFAGLFQCRDFSFAMATRRDEVADSLTMTGDCHRRTGSNIFGETSSELSDTHLGGFHSERPSENCESVCTQF